MDNLWALYFTYGVLGGFGTGIIYVGIIGLMVRWFPDRRGLATGLAAAGYGFGAVFTSFPDRQHDQKRWLWADAGRLGHYPGRDRHPRCAMVARAAGELSRPWHSGRPLAAQQTRRSYSPREMLQNPVFYLLFLMMSMMSTAGLMVVSNVGPFAKEFGVADMLVLGMAALPLSLTLSRVTNGLTRPFFGWVSDHIGREATMALAFSLEAVAILVLFAFINQPALFVVLTGLVFFGWGEIFSLFPSTLTDTFGPKYAATNYGFLYIAQGVGSILGGPAAAFLKQTTGNWTAVFIIVAVLDALTALLAITALRTMRQRHFASQ